MNEPALISTQTLCTHYNIEISFVDTLHQMGLIQIEWVEQAQYIHFDQIGDLERIVRLHKELNLNPEGIDVVLNLLDKEREMREELKMLRAKLSLYEG